VSCYQTHTGRISHFTVRNVLERHFRRHSSSRTSAYTSKAWSNEIHSEIVLSKREEDLNIIPEDIEIGILLRRQQMYPLRQELPSLLLESRHLYCCPLVFSWVDQTHESGKLTVRARHIQHTERSVFWTARATRGLRLASNTITPRLSMPGRVLQ
jgi:hypothetical protein